MAASMECFLHCCDDTHDPITLPDGQDVTVGRKRELKIKNIKLSRNQVQLTANYEVKEVKIKQLGRIPSSIGGKEIKKGETAILGPGGKICLMLEQYPHFIYFKTNPTMLESPVKSTCDAECNEMNKDRSKTILGKHKEKRRIDNDTDDDDDDHKITKKAKIASTTNDMENKKDQDVNLSYKDISDAVKVENLTPRKRKREESDDDGDPKSPKKAKLFSQTSDLEIKKEENRTFAEVEKDISDAVDEDNTTRSQSSAKPCTTSFWQDIPGELLVYTRKDVEGRSKIAGFDMDGTLITTKSGRVFPTSTADWKIALPQIPGRLKTLWKDEYKIVIFTNQNGIAKKKVSIPDFKKKIENVVEALSVPVQVLISPGTGHYHKPSMGMWNHLCEKLNQGVSVNKEKSFYIGDAAGRPADWAPGKKKDFSCSDRAFAVNIGIKFQTPEEFFLDKKQAPFNLPVFDPKLLDVSGPLYSPSTASLVTKEQEVIVMVGFPASGKSTFCEEHLVPRGYARVNRDTLGTWQKCVTACRNALTQGKSVVIDNTNPDKESRRRFIEVAKAAKVPVRCFLMDVSKEHAQHNNTVRETLNTDKNYKHVGHMVFNMYKSSYLEPSCDEGFKEILRIKFKPKFKDARTKELYNQFL